MSDWLLKKLLGQDLMDKAWDLVVAEENANIIVNALRPELQDIEAAQKLTKEAEEMNQRADEMQRQALALRLEGRYDESLELSKEAADLARIAAETTNDPIVIKAEGFGDGTGGLSLWQSKRFEEENITIVSSRKVFSVEGIGKLTEAYINHASSSNFGAELVVDGHKWYSGMYAVLSQKSISDSHLAVYRDSDTSEYIIQFSGINFLQSLEVIITANNLTFDVIRANYEMLVQT